MLQKKGPLQNKIQLTTCRFIPADEVLLLELLPPLGHHLW